PLPRVVMMSRLICLTVALLISGCSGNEPIRVYDAPKPASAAPAVKDPTYTILGFLSQNKDRLLFIKLTGRTDELAPHVPDFGKFVARLRCPNGRESRPVSDLRESWKNDGPRPELMAADTIIFGPPQKPFRIRIGIEGGEFTANFKRWAGQVGAELSRE